jgi:hypothetical protein
MLLSELIQNLQNKLDSIGDVECYTNGEHGIGEVEKLTESNISIGSANLQFDTDHLNMDDSDIVCHIGGY